METSMKPDQYTVSAPWGISKKFTGSLSDCVKYVADSAIHDNSPTCCEKAREFIAALAWSLTEVHLPTVTTYTLAVKGGRQQALRSAEAYGCKDAAVLFTDGHTTLLQVKLCSAERLIWWRDRRGGPTYLYPTSDLIAFWSS